MPDITIQLTVPDEITVSFTAFTERQPLTFIAVRAQDGGEETVPELVGKPVDEARFVYSGHDTDILKYEYHDTDTGDLFVAEVGLSDLDRLYLQDAWDTHNQYCVVRVRNKSLHEREQVRRNRR